MNEQFLDCLCYGAMMHALPRNKTALKNLTDEQLKARFMPWMGKVPPQSEQKLNNWLASSINPNTTQAHQLADLSELAELDGLGKKLKKLAKKVVAPIKKIAVDPLKKAFKKLEDNKIVKKIARPLAYAVGAATGTISAVQQLDQARNAAIAAKNESKINDQVFEAQQAQITAAFAPEPVQAAPVMTPQAAPIIQSFIPQQPQSLAPQFSNDRVQRLAPQDEQPRIVGLNTQGIIDHIKQNPVPWAIGAGALLFVMMRPSQPQVIYRDAR